MADTKLDFNTVTMDDLNGKYLEFHTLSGSANVYYAEQDGYTHVFKIQDNAAYGYKPDGKGGLVQDEQPVAKLGKVTVYSKDDAGKDVATEADGVTYITGRDVQDPYVFTPEVNEDTYLGRPAVAFVQALKKHLQSLQFFSYDSYEATEVRILDHIHGGDTTEAGDPGSGTDSDGSDKGGSGTSTAKPDGTTTTSTTTSTTVKPTTTTTSTTSTSTTTTTSTTAKPADTSTTAG